MKVAGIVNAESHVGQHEGAHIGGATKTIHLIHVTVSFQVVVELGLKCTKDNEELSSHCACLLHFLHCYEIHKTLENIWNAGAEELHT